MTKELLQQALDALNESRSDTESCLELDKQCAGYERYDKRIAFRESQLAKHDAVIGALQKALAQQEQPAQETCWCDQNNIGEPGVSCGDCPTRDYKQPALSDLIELAKVYSQQYASPHHIVFSVDGLRHLIEAHLKGQK